ncbi:hypothetical protein O9929_17265 [Vibrio lentus]|nr:hypothetical protein [Vibrio lentus]
MFPFALSRLALNRSHSLTRFGDSTSGELTLNIADRRSIYAGDGANHPVLHRF